ncbi:MAG: hypothetical protein WBB98_17650 [Xanthobacteraceae bacterium]
MPFVDLNRHFVPIDSDSEIDPSIGRQWGVRYAGWLDWPMLLGLKRVVVLAEASSGKSEEFKHAALGLRAKGNFAFATTVEHLVDQAFLVAPDDQAALNRWRMGDDDAWFFLDSIDEARLNRKRFDDALQRLAVQLGTALPRAHIFVSCRVSDWRGEPDRTAIMDILPIAKAPQAGIKVDDPDAALLDPIFKREHEPVAPVEEDKPLTTELVVVTLVPLDHDQRRLLAQSKNLDDVEAFLRAIEQQGLDALSERPGDVLDLIRYWGEHGSFASLCVMTEGTIKAKLTEADAYRVDNAELTPNEARYGAERLAAALTLAKSFSLNGPGSAAESSLSVGDVNANELFDDWTTPKINALLRRGIFAPATYGRVRFHHRSTQEYLSAQWLRRIIEAGGDQSEIVNLLFVESYGVKTVVPSLRATAAWLALWYPDVRSEILIRDPILLLTHGDPGSLPNETKSELLLHLARHHAAGDISNDRIDRRSLWLFASATLSDAIREAWAINSRDDFRADLIRLIREGKIKGCIDLAAQVCDDEAVEDYCRVLAAEALFECQADCELEAIAKKLVREAAKSSSRLATGFSKLLFPKYINVRQLFEVIAKTKPAKAFSTEGFHYVLQDLFEACPLDDRNRFIDDLSALCLEKPFVESYRRVSKRHEELCKHLGPIAYSAVTKLGCETPSSGLVQLLSVVERAEREWRPFDGRPQLSGLVRENVKLNRALFWFDIDEVRNSIEGQDAPLISHYVYVGGSPLWGFSERDVPWLEDDLANKSFEDDRRVALSALAYLHGRELKENAARLRRLVGKCPALREDLRRLLKPPKQSATERKQEAEHLATKKQIDAKREKDKGAWLKFRDNVMARPAELSNVIDAKTAPIGWLLNLSEWLARKTKKDLRLAVLEWPILETVLSRPVAENYFAGMKALWRVIEPVSPVRSPGGAITTKWATVLARAGLDLEISSDPGFFARLAPEEIRRVAMHGVLSQQGFPDWMVSLLEAAPSIGELIVADAFAAEWAASDGVGSTEILYYFSTRRRSLSAALSQTLSTIILKSEPETLSMLDRGMNIVCQALLDDDDYRARVSAIAGQRFASHQQASPQWAVRYLGLLFFLNFADATKRTQDWIRVTPAANRDGLTETIISLLFGDHDPVAARALKDAPVTSLAALVQLTYRTTAPADDVLVDGDDGGKARRNDAERGRNAILSALIESRGVQAYDTLLGISVRRGMKPYRIRFRELARGMAERDSESPAWTSAEVLTFERSQLLPPKTGGQLYRVAQAVLNNITWRFDNGDASSRSVLITAVDEEAIQTYLAEQFTLAARGRYHTSREAEIAENNRPDILLSSTYGGAEVAIEAKHGDKGWSITSLEHALRAQLAEDYLRPEDRRHGLLVVTNHSTKRWKHPSTGETLAFKDMIIFLNSVASSLKRNAVGEITVAVVGIDALPRPRTRTPPMKRLPEGSFASTRGAQKNARAKRTK